MNDLATKNTMNDLCVNPSLLRMVMDKVSNLPCELESHLYYYNKIIKFLLHGYTSNLSWVQDSVGVPVEKYTNCNMYMLSKEKPGKLLLGCN